MKDKECDKKFQEIHELKEPPFLYC